MSTPYSNIYDRFLNKISDYSFINLQQTDLEQLLEKYLKSAIVKFYNCKKDLTNKDDINQLFNEDLTEEEVEILASLMIVEWLSPKLNTSEILKQKLGDKEYRLYSQANHIKELRELRDAMKEEAEGLMKVYEYKLDNLGDLT